MLPIAVCQSLNILTDIPPSGASPLPRLALLCLRNQRLWRCCNNRLLKPAPANCFWATVSCSRLLNGPTNTRYHVSSFTVPDSTVTDWPSRMICARTRSASACLRERARLQEELGYRRGLGRGHWRRWWRGDPGQRGLGARSVDFCRFRWGHWRGRYLRRRQGFLRHGVRRHDHFRFRQQRVEVVLGLHRCRRTRHRLVGFGYFRGLLLLLLDPFDVIALARLQLHQEHHERSDREADGHPQPARNRLLCRGLVTAGATLGCRFFLGCQLTCAPEFPGPRVPGLA